MKYSFTKGLAKGLLSAIAGIGIIASFAGFSDITIWGLLEQYIKPILGSLTVGTLITMALNYLKVRAAIARGR